MSPQEAAELLDALKEHHSIIPATHKAMSLAVAALEREAKAEPVAWNIVQHDGHEWITVKPEYVEVALQNKGWIAQPLYSSPPPDRPASQVRDIPEGWVMVPVEPTEEMLKACETALTAWRKTLDPDEAMMRSYRPNHQRRFIASASPKEKAIIRYRAMLAASPPAPERP